MRYYELTYLNNKNLTEDEQKGLSEKVISVLSNPPTKKEDLSFLTVLEFYAQPEEIKEIEKQLKAEKQIDRFMILTKKLTKGEPKPIRRRLIKPKESSFAKASEDKEKKVELKEIEKKLDEILNES